MSIVLWAGGDALFADRQVTTHGMRQETQKIFPMPKGEVVGITGDFDSGLAMVDWFARGANPKDWPACQSAERWAPLVVLHRNPITGRPECYRLEREPFRMLVLEPFSAWGSGRDYAIGALHMGATGRQAVEVASKYDNGCGMGIDEYALDHLRLHAAPAKEKITPTKTAPGAWRGGT